VQLHSKTVPEGIVYEEVGISGYLEGVKVYEEEVIAKEEVEDISK
jgi:hypothetical protein